MDKMTYLERVTGRKFLITPGTRMFLYWVMSMGEVTTIFRLFVLWSMSMMTLTLGSVTE